MTVLPHEDPKVLKARIARALKAGKPRNDEEVDLICRIERQKWEIDRAERVAAAHLAHKVRTATPMESGTLSADDLAAVHELGSKLFFVLGMGPGYADATPDEYPAVIVRRLEQSSGGCRWLLNSWAEVLNVIHCQAAWGEPEIIRFVGLLGKRGIEAYFDAELNSLFHAFDRLFNGLGQKFWNARRDRLPVGFRGGFKFASYREVATAPSNEDDAWLLICTVAERQIDRLEKLLEFHKAIEAEEASERDDLAALDTSPAFERHRRYRSALHRELMKLMDALRKARGEACADGVAGGEWRVASELGSFSTHQRHGSIAGHSSGWLMSTPERRRRETRL
jgi:hypothetical protein